MWVTIERGEVWWLSTEQFERLGGEKKTEKKEKEIEMTSAKHNGSLGQHGVFSLHI